jgi:hypothetical protein
MLLIHCASRTFLAGIKAVMFLLPAIMIGFAGSTAHLCAADAANQHISERRSW